MEGEDFGGGRARFWGGKGKLLHERASERAEAEEGSERARKREKERSATARKRAPRWFQACGLRGFRAVEAANSAPARR